MLIFDLGTCTAILQYVTCLTTVLAQKDRISVRLRFPPDSDYTSSSYEINSLDSGPTNNSDYFGPSLKPILARLSNRGPKWFRFFDKLKPAVKLKRYHSWRRDVLPKRSRINKTRLGLTRRRGLRNFNSNSSEEEAVVSPYPAGSLSLREPSLANFSEYEEKFNNVSVVLSSESVVTDYDYGYVVNNKGFRFNTVPQDGPGMVPPANNVSAAFSVDPDVISHPDQDYRWGFLSLFSLVLMGGLGNVLVCLSICLERRLQNVTNYFLLSLAVADLLVCVAVMPFSIGDAFYGHWPFGWHLCSFWVSCDVLSCSSSILHMCVVSVGRYMGIRNPLKTRSKASGKRTALVKIVLVWMASCAIASPIAVLALLDPTNIQPRDDLCAINNRFFFVFGSLFAFYAPMVVMVTSYALTVHLLRKKAQFCQMENVCSATTIVGGGTTGKVNLTSYEVDTCLRCGERTAAGKSKTSTWKTLMLPKRRKNSNDNKNAKCNRSMENIEAIKEPTTVQNEPETEVTRTVGEEEVNGCRYCGSSNSKERQRFPGSFLRGRKRASQRSGSDSYDSAIASTSGSNSVLHKVSTSSKHENGKNVCRKESVRSKGGPTMFRVLGSTTRAQVHNEQKATKVLGLVFFAFVVCWSPFFVLNIIFAVSGPDSLPEYLATTFLWLGYVSSTINPLIYTAFNRTFRRAFWKLLTCGKCGGTGFTTAYAGSRMERGFRATSTSTKVKHRVEWGSERVKRAEHDARERLKYGLDKDTLSKMDKDTENKRHLHRGSENSRKRNRRKGKCNPSRPIKCLVASARSCECGLRDSQLDESVSDTYATAGTKQTLVKSLSTSCTEELQRAAEEGGFRQDDGFRRLRRTDSESRIAFSVEDFGSFKNRKQTTGRRRQQLRLTSQKDKKMERNQTFC